MFVKHPPSPTYENRLDLWPTDLNIDRDHLLIKDYLPTKFEASGAKHYWSVSQGVGDGHDFWPLPYWPEYQYGSSIGPGLSTYQVWRFWVKAFFSNLLHKVWRTNMTFRLLTWISIGIIYSLKTIYLSSLKLLRQSILDLFVARGVGDQHDLWLWPFLWPTELTINWDHLLIKNYIPTKFEASGTKRSWVIHWTGCRRLT